MLAELIAKPPALPKTRTPDPHFSGIAHWSATFPGGFAITSLLSLCLLGHSAPALANAVAVCDGRELSDNAILCILLKDSKIKLDSNRKKVVEYSLKLTKKHNPPLTAKEKREIKDFLLPNRDEVSRWTLSDGRLRDRFRDVYEHCLTDILRGHPDITGCLWVTAGNVADMLIP